MNNGVYRICNLITNQIYIGSSAGKKGFSGRWACHKNLLRKNKHTNPKLQNSWNKYGEHNFSFDIIEYSSKENCINREQYSSKRRIPIIAINLNTKEEIKFAGVGIAARTLNLDTSMISKVCKGQHKYYKEWTFKYAAH